MSNPVDTEGSKQIRLSDIIEFCGWLSIVTLMSGYIWVNVVTWGEGIKFPQYFTISDYVAHGASPAILFTSIVFLMNTWNTIPDPDGKSKNYWKNFIIITFTISVIISIISILIRYYSGESIISTTFILRTIGNFAYANAVPLGIFIVVYAPIRINFLTFGIILALVVWTNTAYTSVLFSLENKISDEDINNPVRYEFQNSSYTSDKWILFLSTDRYFYFLRQESKEIEIQKASDLMKITLNSPKHTFSLSNFFEFLRSLSKTSPEAP